MDDANLTQPERQELKHEPRGEWPQIQGVVLAATVFWLVALCVWGAYVGKVAGHGAH